MSSYKGEIDFAKAHEDIAAIIAGMDDADDDDPAQCRACLDELIEILLNSGLADFAILRPEVVGIHPDNRDGLGCSGQNTHALGNSIVRMGWSDGEADMLMCFEDMDDKRGAACTVRLQHASGKLAHQQLREITHLAISGCHTNQFLLALKEGVPCDEEEYKYIAQNGRMSESKVTARDKNIRKPLKDGMRWLVIKKEAWQKHPKLPRKMQAAANAPGQSVRKVTLFQHLCACQQDAAAFQAANRGHIDWQVVINNAKQNGGDLEGLEDAIKWMQTWGGGSAGHWVKEVSDFVSECCPPNCKISADTWKALASWKYDPTAPTPVCAAAVIKCQAEQCDMATSFLTQSDIKGLPKGKGKIDLHHAETILQACRALARDFDVALDKLVFVIGKVDVMVIRFLCKKPLPKKYETVEQIAADFWDECVQHGISRPPVGNPWLALKNPAQVASDAAPPSWLQYDVAGQAVDVEKAVLQSQGIKVGSRIVLSKDKTGQSHEIISITTDGGVITKMVSDGGQLGRSTKAISFKDITSLYALDTRQFKTVLWPAMSLRNDVAFTLENDKAKLLMAMHDFYLQEHEPSLVIKLETKKGVFVKRRSTRTSCACRLRGPR